MSKTVYGVYYDLSESEYTSDKMGWKFYFSSLPHKYKFERESAKRMDWLTDSLSRRFKYKIYSEELALFQLYGQIEKRGYRVQSIAHPTRIITTPTSVVFELEAKVVSNG